MKKKDPKYDVYAAVALWAVKNGAERQAPTNSYEILRLRVKGGVAIAWAPERRPRHHNALVQKLIEAMDKGEPMPLRPVEKVRQERDFVKRRVTIKTLIARDGKNCFYCDAPIPSDQFTIEELVARTHGGPNHISNQFIAHRDCNYRAGHLSAPEKIRLRDELRGNAANKGLSSS